MGLKRTTVFADEDDLATLRTAARGRGVAEAELIREAIHLAALAHRRWDEPFFTREHEPIEPAEASDALTAVLSEVWDAKAEDYRRGRARPT